MSIKVQNAYNVKFAWLDHIVGKETPKETPKSIGPFQFEIVQKFLSQVSYFLIFESKSMKQRSKDPEYLYLKQFVKGFMDDLSYDPFCYLIAVIYMDKIIKSQKLQIGPKNYRYYFSVCIMLASKMYEDRFQRNSEYQKQLKINCMSIKHWNALEVCVLESLKYELFFSFEQVINFINFQKKMLLQATK